MIVSILNAKGQTTVLQVIRDAWQAPAGNRLTWSLMPRGAVIVRFKTKSLFGLAGMFKAPANKNKVRIKGVNLWR